MEFGTMRILHILFTGPYTEGASYQENILPLYHAKLGHEVYLLASCYEYKNGEVVKTSPIHKKIDGCVEFERKEYFSFFLPQLTKKLRWVPGLYNDLKRIDPDLIMLHGIQSLSGISIVKYLKKNKNKRLIVDCHADVYNSARNWISMNLQHKLLWRAMAHYLNKVTYMFYGVLPARMDFLEKVYMLPKEKIGLLLMGAEDDLVCESNNPSCIQQFREKHGISNDDFLIVTGGKINKDKSEVINLARAISELDEKNIKLIIFGSIIDEYKDDLMSIVDGYKVIYDGWIDSKMTYSYFAAAQLALFPSGHSVLWDQAAAQGVPLVVRKWEGIDHIDFGGNVMYLDTGDISEIKEIVMRLYHNKDKYNKMKQVALSDRRLDFFYSNIAKKSLELY